MERLIAGVLLDAFIGDPEYRWHPVRLMGATLTFFEGRLRAVGMDGYGGGILLFVLLSTLWVGLAWFIQSYWIVHVLLLYSLLALHDLLVHAWAVDKDPTQISKLVGRDTSKMDHEACRRAAIESVAENLVDGYVTPLFWYALLGLPGLVLFKVVSTMDSMVGYKNERYLRFGWCGARTDDVMNFVPARLTWLVLGLFGGLKALRIGWQQHAVVPGPNSGWSEAAMAGALGKKLIGPIWAKGELVTTIWLGDPADPPAGSSADLRKACVLAVATGAVFVVLSCIWIQFVGR